VHGSPGGGDTTTYAAWKAANAITDDLADPDQDGLNNFGEFAMGSRFDVPDAAMPTARLINFGGADYLVIDIRRSLAAVDSAVLVVESSAALDSWSADAVLVGELNHGDGTATTTWRSAQPVSVAPQTHLRARFTLR
jgi:hypothetical protein